MLELWNSIVLAPMLNVLIVLTGVLFNNFGLSIIVFTVIVRALMYPLTIKQLHASKSMMTLQPKLAEVQKKYGRDREKLARETAALYKEAGINPMGCLLPTVVQLPIWIALYQAILKVMAASPEDLLDLSKYLYDWPMVQQLIPLHDKFLWFNLSQPDKFLVLPILVAGSMWVQQKMIATQSGDPRTQSMNNMMQWMMPLMFGFFTMQFASGLAIYWVVSNIISIVMQYFVTGWGGLRPALAIAGGAPRTGTSARMRRLSASGQPRDVQGPQPPPASKTDVEKRIENAESGSNRQDSGRSDRARLRAARSKTGRGGGNRPKKG